jgi:hypothetical protein
MVAHTTSNINNKNNESNSLKTKSCCSEAPTLPKDSLRPNFITGYTDGDGSFSVRLRKNSKRIFGFEVNIVYSLGAEINPLNLKLLEKVKDYFGGVGSISKSGGNMFYYEASSLKTLINIRKHFEEFPLQTSKSIHFKL